MNYLNNFYKVILYRNRKRLAHGILAGLAMLLATGVGAWAQSSLIKAGDRQYENLAFKDALSYYQKAHRKDTTNAAVKLKIAESYRKLNDPANAEGWYAQVVDDTVAQAEHWLYYAEALSSNGKYDLAKQWYKRYNQKTGKERRATHRIRGIEELKSFLRNEQFVSVNEVEFNSPESDFSPTFYGDQLVFASAREGKGNFAWDHSNYLDLYRVSPGESSVEELEKGVNGKYHEGSAVFYDSATRVIFTRSNYQKNKLGKSREGVNTLELFYSEKTDDLWSAPERLPFNSAEFSTGHPTIGSDTTLYFASDRPGGFGGTDLYRCARQNGAWGEPVNLGKTINTEGNEMFPFLFDDEQLYFASNGHEGLGGLDVFGVDLKSTIPRITNLGSPINTSADDFGLIVKPDGQHGYFTSNREDGTGNDDIYTFASLKPLLDQFTLRGVINDQKEGTPLFAARVTLLDQDGKTVTAVPTNNQGEYSFMVEPDKQYRVKVQAADYFDQQTDVATVAAKEQTPWQADMALLKDYGFSLFGQITENQSSEPINDVQVTLIDNMTGETVLETTTGTQGSFRYGMEGKKLNDRISYQIKLAKEGYLGKSATFNSALDKPGEINLHDVLNVGLDKIDIGTDIGALIDVQPIYFDLGKYAIRPDAAQELNKIVRTMQENPSLEIELGSHTDARGSASSNLRLSDKRAKASADYIVSQGIDRLRITGKGYGETTILNRCGDGVKCSEDEHQQNRRTEFTITKF
jgi:outer membrane protein OmpA-like peptidoglycan-associated protein/tetratricopeptide (TPR) repeat protein